MNLLIIFFKEEGRSPFLQGVLLNYYIDTHIRTIDTNTHALHI